MRESFVVSSAPSGQMRRSYATPSLAVYGYLVDLTATGSGTASESGGTPSDMQCVPQYKMHMDCGF